MFDDYGVTGEANTGQSMRHVLLVGVALLTTEFIGCDGCTYYVKHTCTLRLPVRTADGRTDVPCQLDLIPVGQPGPTSPRAAQLGHVNEYSVELAWRSGARAQLPPSSRVVVNCAGYERAEGPAFEFNVRLTGCPTVELPELVVTADPASPVR